MVRTLTSAGARTLRLASPALLAVVLFATTQKAAAQVDYQQIDLPTLARRATVVVVAQRISGKSSKHGRPFRVKDVLKGSISSRTIVVRSAGAAAGVMVSTGHGRAGESTSLRILKLRGTRRPLNAGRLYVLFLAPSLPAGTLEFAAEGGFVRADKKAIAMVRGAIPTRRKDAKVSPAAGAGLKGAPSQNNRRNNAPKHLAVRTKKIGRHSECDGATLTAPHLSAFANGRTLVIRWSVEHNDGRRVQPRVKVHGTTVTVDVSVRGGRNRCGDAMTFFTTKIGGLRGTYDVTKGPGTLGDPKGKAATVQLTIPGDDNGAGRPSPAWPPASRGPFSQ